VVRRVLSDQDRDPYSVTSGCFDRRHWAWKLADLPNAVLQCNVHPLALLLTEPGGQFSGNPALQWSVAAGLRYARRIQRRDGSFDQAFPRERSVGATAFLLHALLEAFRCIGSGMDAGVRREVEEGLRRAAEFLCRHEETHGHIANHLAGAALALLVSAEHFGEARYRRRSDALLEKILAHQSPEGWFLEYEGADPGYQTLCLHYLAQIYERTRDGRLGESLGGAVEFLAHFIHPDGSFAGEYGSRRTAVFYPGGLALLGREFPLAAAITRAMRRAIEAGHTVTLSDVDAENTPPLLSNYVLALRADPGAGDRSLPPLPCERPAVRRDFPQAGLYVHGTERYYAVVGASAGGVLKVFAKREPRILWDDGGYFGQLASGAFVTSQATLRGRPCAVGEREVEMTGAFYAPIRLVPSPARFLLLRTLCLTVMRSRRITEMLKRRLVGLLVTRRRRYQMTLRRRVRFEATAVVLEDELSKSPSLRVAWLECGRGFVAMHMASAQYLEGRQLDRNPDAAVFRVDVGRLNAEQHLAIQIRIEEAHA